ncbi:hypothetical protein KS4_25020 [Poriferisphaera corsica]|uniref:Uncharacterized protein n=1 Tax=Poriferisphaera corsica TaxID=2528020 RepID=A0A517YW72_9BACT|nr:hypothetical protein KS4_25020 [Poriferisphaera corsica]
MDAGLLNILKKRRDHKTGLSISSCVARHRNYETIDFSWVKNDPP